MLPRRIFLGAILAASLLAAGCVGGAIKDVSDIQVLQKELTTRFGDQNDVHLAIGVNRGTLYVSFLNSPLNEWRRDDRSRRALETAQFVKTRFRQMNEVNRIAVIFLRRKTRFAIFHQTQTVDSYSFDKDAQPRVLGLPGGPPPPPAETEPTAVYSTVRKQTEIAMEPDPTRTKTRRHRLDRRARWVST